jgi:HK97 family phage portal protein
MEAMLYEVYGESFWYLVRGENSSKIKEVYLLNPAQMELIIEQGELVGYVLHKSDGNRVPFELNEIHHDKRPNIFNEWRGMSVMERAAQYIDIEVTTTSFTLNYMRNNASPSGIVTLPNMEQETFRQFTQQWREGYEGPDNAGKTAFIRGGEATFRAVGATLKDIDQKITREMAKDDVLMMFDMPKGLLGASGEKGLGRSETEALEYIFAKYKVEPMMDRLDMIWQYILNDSYRVAETNNVTHETTIPLDKTFILAQNTEGVDRWITRNEARQLQGLPPIEGGDELPAYKEQDQEPTVKKITLKKAPSKKEIEKKLNDEQESFRKNLVETNEKYVTKIKRQISKFSRKQEYQVISNINASSKAYEEWLFEVKKDSIELAAELMPIFIELMEEQGKDVSNFISGELLTISPEMRKVVEADILKISGVYNTETLRELEKTLTAGQTEGESLAKLKKRVEQVYSEAQGYRAERIARTESLRTSNFTAEQVYKQSGYSSVEWFINPGACEFCATYAGKTKTIGTNFNNIGDVVTGADGGQLRIEYDNIQTPPLHPNCTCSLVPAD